MIFHFPIGFLELEKHSVRNLPNWDLTKGFSPTGTKQKVSPQWGLNKGFSPTIELKDSGPYYINNYKPKQYSTHMGQKL